MSLDVSSHPSKLETPPHRFWLCRGICSGRFSFIAPGSRCCCFAIVVSPTTLVSRNYLVVKITARGCPTLRFFEGWGFKWHTTDSLSLLLAVAFLCVLYEAVNKPNPKNRFETSSQLEALGAMIRSSLDIFLVQKMCKKQGK
jgi:hypothetical protein